MSKDFYDNIFDKITSSQQNALSDLDTDYKGITLSEINKRLEEMEKASAKSSKRTFVISFFTLLVSIIGLCATLAFQFFH